MCGGSIWCIACTEPGAHCRYLQIQSQAYGIDVGENEAEQMQCVMEIAGLPPADLLQKASRRDNFFEADGTPRLALNKAGLRRYPGSKELSQALNCNDLQFVSFLQVAVLCCWHFAYKPPACPFSRSLACAADFQTHHQYVIHQGHSLVHAYCLLSCPPCHACIGLNHDTLHDCFAVWHVDFTQ